MNTTTITQNDMILAYLQTYGSISALEALTDCGCFRLASRISDLKKMGYNIAGKMEKVHTKFGGDTYVKRYTLAEETV